MSAPEGRPLELTTGGLRAEPGTTLLAARAQDYLRDGPADSVDLIRYVCNLSAAPRIVAEHMAHAMFAGHREFRRDPDGRWILDGASAGAALLVPSAELLLALPYVVVDVETTGTRAYGGDRITEIAAVVVRNGEVAELFETLVNPERSIPAYITRLTSITSEMVQDAPVFSAIESDLLNVLSGNVFAAHNAGFDWRFVCAELARASGQVLAGRRLCTVRLARKLLPQLPRRSLDHVARYYGVEIRARHRAAGDALATARCLVRLLSDAADRGCVTWPDLDTLLGTRMVRRRQRRRAMPTPVDRDTTA